jgi:hypothetical protein
MMEHLGEQQKNSGAVSLPHCDPVQLFAADISIYDAKKAP